MMTQPLRASILSAPLAAIDRRELSQAWYSALGYARDGSRARNAQRQRSRVPARSTQAAAGTSAPSRSSGPALSLAASAVARAAATPLPMPANAVTAHVRLARAIVRAFGKPARPPAHATVCVEGTAARVFLLLRDTPKGLRLVAICAPPQRPLVERALERARRAMALRGIGLIAQTWN
jgi:hypothetical protein